MQGHYPRSDALTKPRRIPDTDLWSQTASSRLYSREAAGGRDASSRQSAPPPKPISESSKRLLHASRATASPPHTEHTPAAQSSHGVQDAARPATTDFSGGGRGALRVISNVRASGEVGGSRHA
ncbi:hypothetical protein T484DRAFT_1927101, partial [Baffinella frigidus]